MQREREARSLDSALRLSAPASSDACNGAWNVRTIQFLSSIETSESSARRAMGISVGISLSRKTENLSAVASRITASASSSVLASRSSLDGSTTAWLPSVSLASSSSPYLVSGVGRRENMGLLKVYVSRETDAIDSRSKPRTECTKPSSVDWGSMAYSRAA